nr:low molecular weight protein-tyrosine-phosphatase [Nocardioides potassii]
MALVCLGNICRSPTAHVVLEQRIADAGLDDVVEVASSGTGGWHVGNPMDPRAAQTLRAAGYDPTRHRARQWDTTWPEAYDVVLVMDEQNLADVGGRTDRVGLLRDFDPVDRGSEVPDPYYGGTDGFEEVLAMVERTSEAIVRALPDALATSRGDA